MSKRTTLTLAAITAAMLAFIALYERHTLSSGELEARRGRVLDRLVRGRVHRIVLRRGGETVLAMVRDRDAEETLDTFDVGTWRITQPLEVAADADAVDGLILACEGLSARRSFEEVGSEDRARFGVDSPRLELELGVANETQRVRVGAEDERLGGVYVEVVESGRVYLVGRDFFEALDHGVDHFRSKEIVRNLAIRDVTAVELEVGRGESIRRADLVLEDRRWRARAPFEGWARKSTVDALLDALVDSRAARFPDDEAALFASPSATVAVRARDRDERGRETGRVRTLRVVLGSTCAGASDERGELLAVRVDEEPAACVPERALRIVFEAMDTLRETRLAWATEDQVERVLLATRGGSAREIELRREGSEWVLTEHGESQPAEASAVAEYLRALREHEAEAFEPASEENLRRFGLAEPLARVRLHRSDVDGLVETIDVGNEDTVGIWVRRSDEPVIARYVGQAAELLHATSLRFRSRKVVDREADDVVGISIVRAGVEERLVSDGGVWRIEAPHALAADRVAVRDLVRSLTGLRAIRWEPPDAARRFGEPRLRVVLRFRESASDPDAGSPRPTVIEIAVGARVDGGALARLGADGDVFVLSEEILPSLERPLVDRELLALDSSEATRIALTTREGTVVIERTDASAPWTSGGRTAAPDATERFVDRLRSLRARGVRTYGGEIPSPRLTVEITSRTGQRRLRIGSTSGEGSAAVAPAVVDGVPVTFELGEEVVEAIAGYRP